MPSKEYVEECTVMMKSATWLCDELTDSRSQILVLDCRPYSEFQQAHVRGAINVALPSLMQRRLENGKLSLSAAIKCNEGRDKFSKSCKTHTIVLLDDRGEGLCGVVPVLLRHLEQDGCHVVFIEGGFKTFHALYPEWCRVEGGDTPVIGLQNLHISCSDSESDEDPFGCESSLGRDTPFDDNSFPVEILDYLFLGNAKNSADEAALEKYNIKYILNVTCDLPNVFEGDANIKYMQIPIRDHWSQDLASFFTDAIAFIEEARQQNVGVLVHCLAGISRSVTIIVAYLMHSQHLNLDDAYDFVKRRKANISPNFNFMGQLQDFERQLQLSPTGRLNSTCCCSSSYSSSSAFSSPDLTPSPFCHCHNPRERTMHFMDTSNPSPDSGVEFEHWT